MKTFELPAGEYGIARVRPSSLIILGTAIGVAVVAQVVCPPSLGTTVVGGIFVVIAAAMLLSVFPVRAEVGDDGIFLSWFGRGRFVPYRRVRSVTTVERTIVSAGRVDVLLDDGERLRLTTHTQRSGSREMTSALAASIESGRRAADAAGQLPALVQREPGERAHEFVARARGLLAGESARAAFRAQAIPVDALEAKLRDASADPEERVGAALALRAHETGLSADLVRVVSDGTANPALRIAVGADGLVPDDDDIARELDRYGSRRDRS